MRILTPSADRRRGRSKLAQARREQLNAAQRRQRVVSTARLASSGLVDSRMKRVPLSANEVAMRHTALRQVSRGPSP